MAWALHPGVVVVVLHRTHHTPHTHFRAHFTTCHLQSDSTPTPVPQLTRFKIRFSCLRAAHTRQDLLADRPGRRDPWFVLPAS